MVEGIDEGLLDGSRWIRYGLFDFGLTIDLLEECSTQAVEIVEHRYNLLRNGSPENSLFDQVPSRIVTELNRLGPRSREKSIGIVVEKHEPDITRDFMGVDPYDQIHYPEKLPVVDRRVVFDEIAFDLAQELPHQR